MKKFIGFSLLVISFLFAGSVSAQNRGHHPQQDRNWEYSQRHDNGRHRGWDRHRNDPYVYIVNEYRYVQYGNTVYKETYRTTYTRDGRVVNRIRVDSQRVRDYDRNHNRFRFNVFLRL